MGTDVVGSELPWVTAIAATFPPYDFVTFHTVDLPELVAERGALVAADLAGLAPIAFRDDDGTTFTWQPTSTGVAVVAGDADAGVLVELSGATFSEYLHELLSAVGADKVGRARVVRGTVPDWERWEPAIRTLTSGRPIYGPAVWDDLVDAAGAPLDLFRRFTLDDDPAEMRHFLLTAGFLHCTGVFTPDEVAALGAEVERARAASTPDDGNSWWSITADGADVVTRINYLGRFSRSLDEIGEDPRLVRLARLADPDVEPCGNRLDGPMVFVKHSDVVRGNGDLVWHVDDGLGGHPVMCPMVQTGIQLDAASAGNGQLMVLAGSHRATKRPYAWGSETDLPVVAFTTVPGDVTVHFGDTMHSTPPPTAPGAGRRVLYLKFVGRHTLDWVPEGCHYNDALFRPADDGRVAARATTWNGAPER